MTTRKLISALLTALPATLFAQYYDQGQEPASIKWNVLRQSTGKIIYSQPYEDKAFQVARIMDTLKPVIGHSFRYGPMRIPVILHSQNFRSNGLVILAPKRMELITVPEQDIFSEPWLKQLTSHEMRHAVQYNNINRNFVKALGYLIGQQAPLAATALMPLWFMEGDAVMAETQLSTYGRGLQPSFTIEYRYFADMNQRFPLDKWFCGSYKTQIPDHYQLGYQIVSYAYDRYGENPWDKVINYSSKYPFLLLTGKIGLHKYYHTSVNKLTRATFDDLYKFWRSLPRVENTASVIPTRTTSFTTYSAAQQLNDTTLVAAKRDMDNPSRIVVVDPRTASEKVLAHTGSLSSQPVLSGGTLYWTEYRPSTLWEQRVNSVLCKMNVATATKSTVRNARRVLYPAPMPNHNLALVEYDYNGTYSIRHSWASLALPDSISVHGLAYDEQTDRLYFIALSDRGMWLGSAPSNLSSFSQVTSPAYITIKNLRAANGRLYFNSIASGKDEAHLYDLAERREYRISESTYGSFAPVPTADAKSAVMTTFTGEGYMISHQKLDSLVEVPYANIPKNTINPPRKGWNVAMNIDSVDVAVASPCDTKPRRYRKGLNLFNFHSWAPLYLDPENIIDDIQFRNIYFGATVMSQNLLGSMSATFSYGYTDQGNLWRGKIGYYGLPVKGEVEVMYGGGNRSAESIEGVELPSIKRYFGIAAKLYVPINLSAGYHSKRLTPILEFTHDNAAIVNNSMNGYREGRDLMNAEIQYVDNVAMAARDFKPRYGYALRVSNTFSPTNNNFSHIWSLYARGYLPGVARHHSLTIEANAERQKVHQAVGEFKYNFTPRALRVNGYTSTILASRYYAGRLSYQLPVWYPDGGISSIIYFKRIRVEGVVAGAHYRDIWANNTWRNAYSYGGEIFLDVSPLRMPASVDATFSVGVFKPSDRRGVVVSTNISIPL